MASYIYKIMITLKYNSVSFSLLSHLLLIIAVVIMLGVHNHRWSRLQPRQSVLANSQSSQKVASASRWSGFFCAFLCYLP